jgi:hypothetical protein
MTFLAKDSFDCRAVGEQADGMRPSAPIYSFGKGTRDQMDKIFLSAHAEKIKGNRDTPGPIYNVPNDLGQAPKFGFGTGPQRVYVKPGGKYPDSSVDLIMHTVDSGYAKFQTPPAFYFGTEAKDCMKNAAITKNHQAAVSGAIGPGPAAYIPNINSSLEEAPSYPFGVKTKILELPSSTPLGVGPGKYALNKAIGKQALSTRSTLPSWSMNKSKRFPNSKPDMTVLEPKIPGTLGKQVLSRTKSAPCFGFGTATRDHRSKTGCYILPEDSGPANDKGHFRGEHPKLQMQKMVVKYSGPTMNYQGYN